MIEEGNNGDLIAIGRIRKPFGLKGQCYADAFGGAMYQLKSPCRVFYGIDETQAVSGVLVEIRDSSRGHICRFEGCDTVEQAEIYRGVLLFVNICELPRLADNEYYHFELQGMTVVSVQSNRTVGVVTAIENYPTVEALNVRREDGVEILIAMNRGFIEKIDREKKCIFVTQSALEQIIS
jgi:16S rRNA processing protein RimM